MVLKFGECEATAPEKMVTAINRPLVVSINGRPLEVAETIEQFAWFASAFRSVGENATALSLVDFRVVSVPSESQELVTELITLPLRTCVPTEPSYGSRWLSLVRPSALAWGFPIKKREQAIGLEISFQHMLKACRVLSPVGFLDSVVIRQGPLTIYPIAKHRDGIQWHAVLGDNRGFSNELKIFSILPLEEDTRSFYLSRGLILTGDHVFSRTFVA